MMFLVIMILSKYSTAKVVSLKKIKMTMLVKNKITRQKKSVACSKSQVVKDEMLH